MADNRKYSVGYHSAGKGPKIVANAERAIANLLGCPADRVKLRLESPRRNLMPKEPRRIDHVEAMNHLDPAGALAGLGLDDAEGMAMRAAVDLVGARMNPPQQGNAAIRAALKDYLVTCGLWPPPDARR